MDRAGTDDGEGMQGKMTILLELFQAQGFLTRLGFWPSSFLVSMHQNEHCILKVRIERKGYVNQVETETIQHA